MKQSLFRALSFVILTWGSLSFGLAQEAPGRGGTGPYTVRQTGDALLAAYDEIDKVAFDPNEFDRIKDDRVRANTWINDEKSAHQRKDASLVRHIDAQIRANNEDRKVYACESGCVSANQAEPTQVYQARIDSTSSVIDILTQQIREETRQGGDANTLKRLEQRKRAAEDHKAQLIAARSRSTDQNAMTEIRRRLIASIDEQNSLLAAEKANSVIRAGQREASLEELRLAIPKPSWLLGTWIYEDANAANPVVNQKRSALVKIEKTFQFSVSSLQLTVTEDRGRLLAEVSCSVAVDDSVNKKFRPDISFKMVTLAGWKDTAKNWSGTWSSAEGSGTISINVPGPDHQKDGISLAFEQTTADTTHPTACHGDLHRKP